MEKTKTHKTLLQRLAEEFQRELPHRHHLYPTWEGMATLALRIANLKAQGNKKPRTYEVLEGLPRYMRRILSLMEEEDVALAQDWPQGLRVVSERTGKSAYGDARDDLFDIELGRMLAHAAASEDVRTLVLADLGLPPDTTISDIRAVVDPQGLTARLTIYNRLLRAIRRAGLDDPRFDYRALEYRYLPFRHSLTSKAERVLSRIR